jgi:hypothetical protein
MWKAEVGRLWSRIMQEKNRRPYLKNTKSEKGRGHGSSDKVLA